MSESCIDCGSPVILGSSYCGPCDAPIFESPREMRAELLAEIEAES